MRRPVQPDARPAALLLTPQLGPPTVCADARRSAPQEAAVFGPSLARPELSWAELDLAQLNWGRAGRAGPACIWANLGPSCALSVRSSGGQFCLWRRPNKMAHSAPNATGAALLAAGRLADWLAGRPLARPPASRRAKEAERERATPTASAAQWQPRRHLLACKRRRVELCRSQMELAGCRVATLAASLIMQHCWPCGRRSPVCAAGGASVPLPPLWAQASKTEPAEHKRMFAGRAGRPAGWMADCCWADCWADY